MIWFCFLLKLFMHTKADVGWLVGFVDICTSIYTITSKLRKRIKYVCMYVFFFIIICIMLYE